jgi:general secretion pathway protein L
MAHKILGIDFGAYSVKVAELEAGFRQAQLVGLYERTLLPAEAGETELKRAARTLKALIDDERLEPEMCATTMGGEAVIRLLSVPFADRKKIEQVLGFELESQILGEVEGLVIDFVLSTSTPEATHVITVASPKEDVKARIEALQQVGAEPRMIGAAALSYAALRQHAYTADAAAQPQLIIDVGHRHTHVCVVAGETILFARAIPRGGEDVTLAIIDAYKMTPEDAERSKHEQAFLLPAGATPESPAHRKVDTTVREGVRPLVRELRQTLAAYRAGGGAAPGSMLLTGGGARLRGLAEHLEVELGLPVGRLQINQMDPFVSPTLRLQMGDDGLQLGLPAQALGLAIPAAAPVPQVNLRKGELAYRSDYSYLRGKAGYLAAAILAILMFAAINAVAALRASRKEADALEFQLKKATLELFGEARLDGKAVSDELHAGPKGGGAPPIPTMTAYDVLDEISRHVPPSDKGKLDVTELDIKPKKVYLKATAESVQQIDDLVAALQKIECFEKVDKGKISSVTSPPSGDNAKGDKPSELKQFALTINTTCP